MHERALILATLVLACTPPGDRPPEDASSGPGTSSFGPDEPTSSGGEASTSTGVIDGSSGGGESSGSDATTGEVVSEDEALLRRAIAGEVDPDEALRTIAGRGGLPVETVTGSYLFACLCGPGEWQLAGDHDGWAGAPLELAGPLAWIEVEVPAPLDSLYKFHEPGDELWIADPLGRRYGYDENGEHSLVRAEAAHLERWYGVEGAGLQPRDLQVYVPAGGAFSHALYVHDGQNLFDPSAPFGYWQLQDSAPPELLLVGIDNTPARMDEYTHVPDDLGDGELGGQAGAYAEFVDAVVRPRMEAAYGEAAVVGTMGSSLGGLVALVLADLQPERYAMAISLSGTLGWGSIGLHNQTIIERYAAAGKRAPALYVDSGGQGPCGDLDMDGTDDDTEDADNYCENAQMRDVLTGLGYSEGVDLWYVHAPGEPHDEPAWAKRVGGPMATFVGL